jgi:hypothetical protein
MMNAIAVFAAAAMSFQACANEAPVQHEAPVTPGAEAEPAAEDCSSPQEGLAFSHGVPLGLIHQACVTGYSYIRASHEVWIIYCEDKLKFMYNYVGPQWKASVSHCRNCTTRTERANFINEWFDL